LGRLANTQKDAGPNELTEAGDQSSGSLCKGPQRHPYSKQHPRSSAVHQTADRQLDQRVTPGEG
jgi:hypothetical protein